MLHTPAAFYILKRNAFARTPQRIFFAPPCQLGKRFICVNRYAGPWPTAAAGNSCPLSGATAPSSSERWGSAQSIRSNFMEPKPRRQDRRRRVIKRNMRGVSSSKRTALWAGKRGNSNSSRHDINEHQTVAIF